MCCKGRETSRAPSEEETETVIGPTASFQGTIRSKGNIRIEGVFEGVIETTGNLIIGDQAKVLADIVAHNILSVADAVGYH
jgi:cytoskeletal protein CcmA (bactofilin family)